MIVVGPAAFDDYEPALELLFARLSSEERKSSIAEMLKTLRRGRMSSHALLTARVNGTPQGAVLYLVQEDRTAFVWPPGISFGPSSSSLANSPGESPDEIADALLQALIERIEQAGVWIGQCFLAPHLTQDRQILVRNGFNYLTDMRFLVRLLDDEPATHLPGGNEPEMECEIETYQPGTNDGRLARVIERTYGGTRDCPELEGLRTGEQALASHRTSGEFDPSRWFLFRRDGDDAAVLLMNNHVDPPVWEVVYMGVTPEHRGHGLGRRMLLHGLTAARAARRTGVLLAVDCRNDYAIDVYEDLGFVETDRKSVHLYFPLWPRPAGEHR